MALPNLQVRNDKKVVLLYAPGIFNTFEILTRYLVQKNKLKLILQW